MTSLGAGLAAVVAILNGLFTLRTIKHTHHLPPSPDAIGRRW